MKCVVTPGIVPLTRSANMNQLLIKQAEPILKWQQHDYIIHASCILHRLLIDARHAAL